MMTRRLASRLSMRSPGRPMTRGQRLAGVRALEEGDVGNDDSDRGYAEQAAAGKWPRMAARTNAVEERPEAVSRIL